MRVKICGITTVEAAETAVQAGADWIGFVFAPSKRKISSAEAQEIAGQVPASIQKIGVFVNESPEKVNSIAEQVGLDMIQLHGDETPEYAEQLNYPIIKAFSVKPDNVSAITHYPCTYYLVDSPVGPNRGGNGNPFDWALLDRIEMDRDKLILAGGLNPANIQEAIQAVRPAGVDVSSGVETDGQKDPHQIKLFIQQAKRKGEGHDNLHHA